MRRAGIRRIAAELEYASEDPGDGIPEDLEGEPGIGRDWRRYGHVFLVDSYR